MSYRKMAVLLLAFTFVMVPLGLSSMDNAEAADLEIDSNVSIGSFNERSEGRVSVTIYNDTDSAKPLDVYVTWLDGSGRLAEKSVEVPAKEGSTKGSVTVDLYFKISSPGTHHVKIWAVPAGGFPVVGGVEGEEFNWTTAAINVDSSIWSNTSTYIIIVVVVIIVIVAVYLRMRSSRVPKSKGTFTAMEAEKKATKDKRVSRNDSATRVDAPVKEVAKESGKFTAMEAEKKAAKEKKSIAPVETPAQDVPVQEAQVDAPVKESASATTKQEYTGKVNRTKPKQQTSANRKSNPNSRKSSKRK